MLQQLSTATIISEAVFAHFWRVLLSQIVSVINCKTFDGMVIIKPRNHLCLLNICCNCFTIELGPSLSIFNNC